jgi:lipoprotein-releasing system ATP-binding protein
VIEVKNIVKEFGQPPQRIIHDISFTVETGKFVAISGRSGSGKSTLLYIMSTLGLPTSGHIYFEGQDVFKMGVEELHRFRNSQIGFIFQFHYLLPELDALDNILLPARCVELQLEKEKRAWELLELLNISHAAKKLPSQLSGGEQQRVAIARALIMEPTYLFADEPTGNLDTANGKIVMEILKSINREKGTTICLVTHDPNYAAMADSEIYLIDGRLSSRNNE